MDTNISFAHSARRGASAQTYYEHVSNVRQQVIDNAKDAVVYYHGERDVFVKWIDDAAVYHDLGKLDNVNQTILQTRSQERLPIDHDDAGVAALLKLGQRESAVLVAAHHAGLFSKSGERPPNKRRLFRNERQPSILNGDSVDNHVDSHLKDYLIAHEKAGLSTIAPTSHKQQLHRCGFTRRVALSCLVDADHGDTARHYGNEVVTPKIKPRWAERLIALEQYVDQLPVGNLDREQYRNCLRKRLFEACRDASIEPPIRTCDAPVGSGKTTAIMAHLLRVAAERSPELRHIIVVLPFTNIITQSVEIYRKALVLDGECPEDVVAEHHHRADFDDIDLRQLATLWKAPIIVTTAVQFFETLGSCHPARLRKLHELPGSAVFVDEMHAAIPSHLWPQMWRWLETWVRNWGGHLVLASGSLSRFWELDGFKDVICSDGQTHILEVPDIVSDSSLRNDLKQLEERRIRYRRRLEDEIALDCCGVIDFVQRKPGPRLFIVNTVQTAAVLAKMMRKSGYDVLHLSTSLAPVHRDLVVAEVKRRLHSGLQDWTLVATSCVEAGMNFSFRIGFRERASTASLIQVGGRISRGDEFTDAEVWDLLLRDNRFRDNPAISVSHRALGYFSVDDLNDMHPSELATYAMKYEWTIGAREKAEQLIEYEDMMEYPSVSNGCQVIKADTRTVLIDKVLVEAIRKGKKVSGIELIKHSVQLWTNRIDKLSLGPIIQGNYSDNSIYEWPYDYDSSFLGYMEGVLKIEEFISAGWAII